MDRVVFCTSMNGRMRRLLSYAMETLRSVASPADVEPLVISDADPRIEGLTWLGPLPPDLMEATERLTDRFADYNGERPSPYMAGRLFLPFMDKLSNGRFVYVDTDVEFVSPHFSDIFGIELDDADCGAVFETHWHAAASVHNTYPRFVGTATNGLEDRVSAGELVNSGVMLVDPGNVKANHPDFVDEAAAWADRLGRHGLYYDQDIVNLMFHVRRIPDRFNVIANCSDRPVDQACIVHYAGHPCRLSGPYPDPDLRRKLGLKRRHTLLTMRPDVLSQDALRNVVRCSAARRACEVGSYRGESARIMLDAGLEQIYCVDPWKAGYDPSDCASQNMDGVERAFDWLVGQDPRTVKCKGTLGAFADRLANADLDLVYVDACHQYEPCLSDLRVVRDVVRPRVIAGHDYSDDWPGVKRAVDELFGMPDARFPDSSWLVFLR